MNVSSFSLKAPYQPTGDQPQAIEALCRGLASDSRFQILEGVTGSGKTFTMANVIARYGRPTLVISHNKTLAAQLYAELKSFFPDNAVEYFVSYYDYYQPEAYIPQTDTFIEKDASINKEIERLRLSATNSLLCRDDVIIVASVSCIYGLGSPDDYRRMVVEARTGESIDRDEVLKKLVDIQYTRNDYAPEPGTFRVRGDTVDVFPSYSTKGVRLDFFGDLLERAQSFDVVSGHAESVLGRVVISPATHFVMPYDKIEAAIGAIVGEMKERIAWFEANGKLLEAQRIKMRTMYDMEMLKEIGFCSGIENYSRHLSGRQAGEKPATLLDYFPGEFLTVIDESHVTLPQIRGMFNGDQARKSVLVEHGFRLPSAKDNRPMNFDEFISSVGRVVFTSATPGPYERQVSPSPIPQLIRPTGLVDPPVQVRPLSNQVDDVMEEIRAHATKHERVLVTTLTKRTAEDLSEYLKSVGIKVRYLHSDIDAIERVEILRSLRKADFDCLIGINLLREGLDLPEVSLVAVLDADKEGFLRSETSLIQTAGRAARHVDGKVILYADHITDSMKRMIAVTEERRTKQLEYNRANNITPQSIQKSIQEGLVIEYKGKEIETLVARESGVEADIHVTLREMEAEMLEAAETLEFERAAMLRDQIKELRLAAGLTGGTAPEEKPTPKKKGKWSGRYPTGRMKAKTILMGLLLMGTMACVSRLEAPWYGGADTEFPSIPQRHVHARALLANAFKFVDPRLGLIDPVSGFPVEGWNHEPERGLYLRSFTQLTAIGEWVELLAAVAAGRADTPSLSRQEALTRLKQVVGVLRQCQTNPKLSDRGLLVNFIGFQADGPQSPLAGTVRLSQLTERFGEERAKALWRAMVEMKWIRLMGGGEEAEIKRGTHYGASRFEGALAPFAGDCEVIMAILDQRVVTVIFGDNANLSASIAKAIGTLNRLGVRPDASLARLCNDMESFLDAQREGYRHLHDKAVDRFYFGWDATRKEMVGWGSGPAYHDYYINEFRGPTLFVVLRYRLSSGILANMGSILKTYTLPEGGPVTVPAAWDGSAFQIFGLSLMMDELRNPAWHRLMHHALSAELDYSLRHNLPGFLSESYSGNGVEYTGSVGIPELAVNRENRITTSPSLYTLGVAYQVDPDGVERWLARNWPVIRKRLLTSHGPWEGLNTKTGEPIRFQTSAHTMALILGLLQTAPDGMRRYLEMHGLTGRLKEWYAPGQVVDFLAPGGNVFAWTTPGGGVEARRVPDGFHVEGKAAEQVFLALVPSMTGGVSVANGRLSLKYRNRGPAIPMTITFKSERYTPPIANQIEIVCADTQGEERDVELILPATPGWSDVKEVVVQWGSQGKPVPVDFTLTSARFMPYTASLE